MTTETRYSAFQKSMRGRWRPEWTADPVLGGLAEAFNRIFQNTDAVCAQTARLRVSGKFSIQGLTEEVRNLMKREAIPALLQAGRVVEAALSDIAAKRAALSLPKADPNDATAAVVRSEMRTWLKSRPRSEALAVLMANNVDERLLIAALEVPPAMIGPLGDARGELEAHILRTRHGKELRRLEEREEAAELVNAALGVIPQDERGQYDETV